VKAAARHTVAASTVYALEVRRAPAAKLAPACRIHVAWSSRE